MVEGALTRMDGLNLFWPVYKNLEREFLKLADYIHFTDKQLGVFSMHIADLIVRCAVEIEAISKELYCKLGGNMSPVDSEGKPRDLYFDTDCIELLEQNWKLSKKKIMISATNFYFMEEANNIIAPLHKANKRGTSGSKWKQAYQAVKHDRRNSLKMGNIENLLHAMGALYILNLYYKNDKIDIGRVYMSDHDFDSRVGSEIFSVFCFKATGLSMLPQMDDSCILQQPDNDLEKSIYIIKYDEKSFVEMHKNYCLDHQITMKNFTSSPEINAFLLKYPEYRDKDIGEICMVAGGQNLLFRIMSFKYTMQERESRMEAILNKHSGIYPTVLPLENQ